LLKVVYIHHCGIFGGSSRSIMELVLSFPKGSVEPFFISQKGSSSAMFASKGLNTYSVLGIPSFDHTRMGYYRGLRWLILLREFAYLFAMLFAFWKNRKIISEVDLIHINDYHLIFALIICKALFKKPIVLHARAIQQNRHGKVRKKLFRFLVDNFADKVIAIDQNVYETLPSKAHTAIVHNGFIVNNGEIWDERLPDWPDRGSGVLNIGFVGNMIEYKGIYEFVKAAKACMDAKIQANFVIIGPKASLYKGFKGWLADKLGLSKNINTVIEEYIKNENLTNIFRVDFQKDVARVYKNLDILCFPSHLEGAGRPVFEAAFFKVPSIVAITDPRDDTIIHGKTGLCIEPKNAVALSEAIIKLATNDQYRLNMGEEAYKLACENFDIKANALTVLEIYKELINYKKA
jgi:glycosyltransferase involved in cell wall biosynthesis